MLSPSFSFSFYCHFMLCTYIYIYIYIYIYMLPTNCDIMHCVQFLEILQSAKRPNQICEKVCIFNLPSCFIQCQFCFRQVLRSVPRAPSPVAYSSQHVRGAFDVYVWKRKHVSAASGIRVLPSMMRERAASHYILV
jgi:hypothetical protein